METYIANWANSELIANITSTLLHSLWQGLIIGIVTAALLKYKAGDNPVLRYRIAIAGIVTLFICSIITFGSYYYIGFGEESTNTLFYNYIVNLSDSNTISSLSPVSKSNWIGLIWIACVLVYTLKLIVDLIVIQYIRFTSTDDQSLHIYYPYLDKIQSTYNQKSKVKLLSSHLITSPVTIGFIKPIILFPIGMINQLTVSEVESILTHEMAHIIRRDYLTNILISMVEVVLFYHPLVWWLSRVVRLEREYCCDDIAIGSNHQPLEYIKTLVKIKELSMYHHPLAIPFADDSMMDRVKRIMNLPKSNSKMKEKIIASVVVLSILVFCTKDMIANVSTKIWNEVKIENNEVEREPVRLNDIKLTQIDTIPEIKKRQSYTITKSDDQGSISLKKEDGEVTELKIDGEVIPKQQYDNYKNQIRDLEGNTQINEKRGQSFMIFGDDDWIVADQFGLQNDSTSMAQLEEKLKNLGLDFEAFGLSIEESFDDDWARSMQEWGESFRNNFSEKMGDSLNYFNFPQGDIMDEETMQLLEDAMENIDLKGLNFHFPENLNLGEHDLFDNYLRQHDTDFPNFRNKTIQDKIGYELRKDRLIVSGEQSEVELSGKHMKINGEKQPTNIWSKYKEMFEESSGIELSKDSKLKFKVEGKKTIKKTSSI